MDNENFNVEFGEVVNIGGGTSDFNQLSNRPNYDNTTMTGATNIPKVPTKTSDLTNDGSDGTSTYVESDDLATVATSGSYNDLSNTPTIPESQVQSDWSQTDNTKVDFIKNKPTIPSAQVNADWNASSGVAEILNKPTIPTVNDATLTITQNGTAKGTFTANDADDTTIEVSDTTYSDFTGTDGTAAGVAGLVPAPATTDAGKFLKADGTWDTVGGGGPTVVQSTGTSTTDVMSQNAVTSMVYADPSTKFKVQIGGSAGANGAGSTAIGTSSRGNGNYSLAIGNTCRATGTNSVAIGSGADASQKGQFDISTSFSGSTLGYNDTQYRLLTGLYDGQSAHDAVTKGQLDSIAIQNAGAPTTSTVGTVGQLYQDTTNGKLYICTDATNPYVWEEVGAGGGGGPTVVQTTGTSTTDVMSQNAVTGMVFADPETQFKIKIGAGTSSSEGNDGIEIGHNAAATKLNSTALGVAASATGNRATAIGQACNAQSDSSLAVGGGTVRINSPYAIAIGSGAEVRTGAQGAIAIGNNALATMKGQFDISTLADGASSTRGYNSSPYRLLTGLYDGQNAHDAATVTQGNTLATSAPTTSTVGVLGQLYTDTTNMHTYQCTAISGDTYTWTQRW